MPRNTRAQARRDLVRRLLYNCEGGMTTATLASLCGCTSALLVRTLRSMQDVYIDRFGGRHGQTAVWTIALIGETTPPDCPRPGTKNDT